MILPSELSCFLVRISFDYFCLFFNGYLYFCKEWHVIVLEDEQSFCSKVSNIQCSNKSQSPIDILDNCESLNHRKVVVEEQDAPTRELLIQ